MIWGLAFVDNFRATAICKRAFELGLLVETSGPQNEVIKLMPALTCTPDELNEGLHILSLAVDKTA
jgi:diaminobutyrate-2-oxoglutarate transaminase